MRSFMELMEGLPELSAEQRPAGVAPKPIMAVSDGAKANTLALLTKGYGMAANHPGAVEGGRDEAAYRFVNRLKDIGISPEEASPIAQGWNQEKCVPPLEDGEIERLVENAYHYGQNAQGDKRDEYITEWGPVAASLPKTEPEKANGDTADTTAQSDDFPEMVPFDDLLNWDVPPVQEVIAGIVEKGIVNFLNGAGGSNKSRLALQWGLCIASDHRVWGRAVQQATFVHLSYEDTREEVARRAQQIARRLDLPKGAPARYLNMRQKPLPLAIIDDANGVMPQPFYEKLRTRLQAIPGHKFVVADSAYDVLQFVGAAKINESAVKAGIDFLDRLCAETDSTLLVLWHPSRSGQDHGDNSGWSVAWHNRPRVRVSITPHKDQEDTYVLKGEKRNNGRKLAPITLRWTDGILAPLTEMDAAQADARFVDACVETAIIAAESDQPITLQKTPPVWVFNEIEQKAGRRPSTPDLKAALAMAQRLGRLRYQKGHGKDRAGYFAANTAPASAPAGLEKVREAVPQDDADVVPW